MKPFISSRAKKLSGMARIPGDKSISHRALMFGLLAEGETMIAGLLRGEDVLRTAQAAQQLGARIEEGNDGLWRVFGTRNHLRAPKDILDMGNSGTAARLLCGLVAGFPVRATFDGDESLRKRPMKRVIEPLSQMGASFEGSDGGRLPLTVTGGNLKAIHYTPPVPSAQVKSAVLLAGLNARGITTVTETRATRDHSENMLRLFGAQIETGTRQDGAQTISIEGGQKLLGCAVDVPGDPSSAAFAAVAACLVPGADVTLYGVCVNPRRTGIYETLREMGADIEFKNPRSQSGEPVADIAVRYSDKLRGIAVPQERVPDMIDEIPVLCVAASCAHGTTTLEGLGELRVKESDRLGMMAQGLAACGVELEEGKESLAIHGTGKPPQGGTAVRTAMDHRIAMSFLVLGITAREAIGVDDASFIDTSFPGFAALMNRLGADIRPA